MSPEDEQLVKRCRSVSQSLQTALTWVGDNRDRIGQSSVGLQRRTAQERAASAQSGTRGAAQDERVRPQSVAVYPDPVDSGQYRRKDSDRSRHRAEPTIRSGVGRAGRQIKWAGG